MFHFFYLSSLPHGGAQFLLSPSIFISGHRRTARRYPACFFHARENCARPPSQPHRLWLPAFCHTGTAPPLCETNGSSANRFFPDPRFFFRNWQRSNAASASVSEPRLFHGTQKPYRCPHVRPDSTGCFPIPGPDAFVPW